MAHRDVDLLLLDLGLPDRDGLDVLRLLRKLTDVPVVVLTARGDERTVVRALRLGADDYLVKPVRMAELLARMDTVSRRRSARSGPQPESIVVDDVTVDLPRRQVTVAGQPIAFTTKEFDLVGALASRAGTAVSRQQLMDELWGDAYLAVSRSLDVLVRQVRVKLDRPGLLTTIRGFGYRFGR